jgi:hypothetical protein
VTQPAARKGLFFGRPRLTQVYDAPGSILWPRLVPGLGPILLPIMSNESPDVFFWSPMSFRGRQHAICELGRIFCYSSARLLVLTVAAKVELTAMWYIDLPTVLVCDGGGRWFFEAGSVPSLGANKITCICMPQEWLVCANNCSSCSVSCTMKPCATTLRL